jgi:hypothetical protein
MAKQVYDQVLAVISIVSSMLVGINVPGSVKVIARGIVVVVC